MNTLSCLPPWGRRLPSILNLAVCFSLTGLLLASVSPCWGTSFNYSGYVEWTNGAVPDIYVGAPGTLTLSVTSPGPADINPDPNVAWYGAPYPLSYSFVVGNEKDIGSGTNGEVDISNTPSGDSVYVLQDDVGTSTTLQFIDTSGNALSSDAWTQKYGRANWQTIEFGADGYDLDPHYTYRARIPLVEAEKLQVQAKSPVPSGTFLDSNLCNGSGSFLRAAAVGDFVTYSVPVRQPGNYIVRVGVQTRPNKGKFQLGINGVSQGPVQDEYSLLLGNGFRDLGTAAFLSPGTELFNFKVTGRNPSSTDYTLAFDYINLIPSDRWEAESEKVQAVTPVPAGYTSAQWFGVFNASAASGGAGTYLNATSAGNYITYTVPVAKAGTYRVRVGVQTKPNKGMFRLAINGVNQGVAQDEYAPSLGYGVRDLGTVYLNSGNQAFKFKVTGKNPSSTGYTLAFDYIELVP